MNASHLTPFCAFAAAICIAAAEEPAPAESPLSPEMTAALEAYIAVPDHLVPVLEGVTDKATADAAAPQLHDRLEEIRATHDAFRSITSLTPEQTDYVQTNYALRMRRQWARVLEQLFRLRRVQCYRSIPFTKEFGNLNMMLSQ